MSGNGDIYLRGCLHELNVTTHEEIKWILWFSRRCELVETCAYDTGTRKRYVDDGDHDDDMDEHRDYHTN